MTELTIRSLNDAVTECLRLRAARHGRSIEDEARDILHAALATEALPPRSLAQAIHERFAALGGVDLPDVPREPSRAPPTFER